MRNPFKRAAQTDPARPTLRERLNATKAKAKRVLAVNAIIADRPSSTPAVDRVALVNYASWLYMEHRMVCRELYPHMGERADRFVVAANAAEQFHYPTGGGFPSTLTTAPKPSTRAVRVLDMVGVDWRSDLNNRAHLDSPSRRDDGRRPAVSHGWPRLDAALLDAFDDLTRLDAARLAMGKAGLCAARNTDTVPGYDGLEDARDDALVRIRDTSAESLIGLQVKAKAILTNSVADIYEDARAIGRSLAGDILGATNHTIEPRPDPVFAVIEESRRLQSLVEAASRLPQPAGTLDPLPEQIAAIEAFNDHAMNVVLTTVPNTAQGCRALARYVASYQREQNTPLDEDDRGEQNLRVLDLIARSPLI